MIDRALLEILRCPESRQPLALVGDRLLQELDARARAGELMNRSGQKVDGPLDGALVREDGRYAYPIRGGIPVLLIDEAILLPPS